MLLNVWLYGTPNPSSDFLAGLFDDVPCVHQLPKFAQTSVNQNHRSTIQLYLRLRPVPNSELTPMQLHQLHQFIPTYFFSLPAVQKKEICLKQEANNSHQLAATVTSVLQEYIEYMKFDHKEC